MSAILQWRRKYSMKDPTVTQAANANVNVFKQDKEEGGEEEEQED